MEIFRECWKRNGNEKRTGAKISWCSIAENHHFIMKLHQTNEIATVHRPIGCCRLKKGISCRVCWMRSNWENWVCFLSKYKLSLYSSDWFLFLIGDNSKSCSNTVTECFKLHCFARGKLDITWLRSTQYNRSGTRLIGRLRWLELEEPSGQFLPPVWICSSLYLLSGPLSIHPT